MIDKVKISVSEFSHLFQTDLQNQKFVKSLNQEILEKKQEDQISFVS